MFDNSGFEEHASDTLSEKAGISMSGSLSDKAIEQFTIEEYLHYFFTSLPLSIQESVKIFLNAKHQKPPSPISLSERFIAFVQAESTLSSMNPEHLVKPSGEIDSELAVKLHYPTFATINLENGTVADYGSSCVRIWMLKGLNQDTCFMYEDYYRRQDAPKNRKSPMVQWTKEHRQVHKEFNQWCDQYSSHKVRLLCGVHVQNAFSRSYTSSQYKILFPGDIEIEARIVNSDVNNEIKLIALYIPHPENYLRSHTQLYARTADITINLATALTKKFDKIDLTFFERRAARKFAQADSEKDTESFNNQGNAMSTIQEALKFEAKTSVHFEMINIPESIKSWLIRKTGIHNLDDIENLLRDTSKAFPDGGSHSLVRSTQILMLQKGADTRAKKREAEAVLQSEKMSKIGRQLPTVVRIYCGNCKLAASEIDDKTPKWDGDNYIARKRSSCPTKGCCDVKTYTPNGQTNKAGKNGMRTRKGERIFILVDSGMEWISYNLVKKKVV